MISCSWLADLISLECRSKNIPAGAAGTVDSNQWHHPAVWDQFKGHAVEENVTSSSKAEAQCRQISAFGLEERSASRFCSRAKIKACIKSFLHEAGSSWNFFLSCTTLLCKHSTASVCFYCLGLFGVHIINMSDAEKKPLIQEWF